MGISNTSYTGDEDETMAEPPSDAKAGPGGETMAIWRESRTTLLKQMFRGGVTNESSFKSPGGVLESPTGGYTSDFSINEKAVGVSVSGKALNPEGTPLSGTAKIEAEGQVFSEDTVSGSFRVSAPPPVGTILGQTLELDDYDFRFSPSMPGLDNFIEGIPFIYNAGTFQYGQVQGQVFDYDGNPVADVAVAGEGASDITDDRGNYALVGPGGSTANLTTFYTSHTADVSLISGEATTRDFTFPKLSIKVVDPDYEPIENAPVEIDDEIYRTNSGGVVEIDDAEIKDYDVKVMEAFDATLSVTEPAQLYQFTVGPGASFGGSTLSVGGVRIKAVDARTGNGIRDLVARERTTGTTSSSNGSGVCKLLTETTGEEVDVLVGTGDKRYLPARIAGTVPQDEMLDVTVELEPRTQVTNS